MIQKIMQQDYSGTYPRLQYVELTCAIMMPATQGISVVISRGDVIWQWIMDLDHTYVWVIWFPEIIKEHTEILKS